MLQKFRIASGNQRLGVTNANQGLLKLTADVMSKLQIVQVKAEIRVKGARTVITCVKTLALRHRVPKRLIRGWPSQAIAPARCHVRPKLAKQDIAARYVLLATQSQTESA